MKKSALILSYHFYPSAEIGARRPSELALSLQQAGWQVTAVAAKSRRKIRADPALGPKAESLQVIRVTDPPSLEAFLVRWIKKMLGRDSGGSGKSELSEPAPHTEPTKASPGRRLWLTCKRYYFSIRHLFGHNKAWATLVFFRLIPVIWTGRYQLIVSSGPPMPSHIVAVAASKLFGSRLVMDMRDPWFLAEFAPFQYRSKLRDRLDFWMEQVCYRNADLIVCTSPGAARQVSARCPEANSKTRIVFNGYDARPGTANEIPTGQLRLLYAGAIYFNRNPFPLFEALQALVREPQIQRSKIRFDLFGHCAAWQGIEIQPWLEERNLTDLVTLHGPVDQVEIGRQTSNANVLVNFAQGQPHQIPAKTFEQLIAGRETLVISETDSDTAGIIRDSDTGKVVAPDDVEQMKTVLKQLYSRYVEGDSVYTQSAQVLRKYSRESQNNRYIAELEQLLST